MPRTICQSTGFYCCIVNFLELVPLRGKIHLSHTHKTSFRILLGCSLNISDEQPRHFYMGVRPAPGVFIID